MEPLIILCLPRFVGATEKYFMTANPLIYSTYYPTNYDVRIPSLSDAANGDAAEDI